MSRSRRVLVVAAMAAETRSLRRRLDSVRRFRWAGGKVWRGVFKSAPETEVWVAHCGMGVECATAWVERVVGVIAGQASTRGLARAPAEANAEKTSDTHAEGRAERNADRNTQRSAEVFSVTARIDDAYVIGLAGALDPELQPGELVEATVVVDAAGDDGESIERRSGGAGGILLGATQEVAADPEGASLFQPGVVVTSATLLRTAVQKADLWRRLGRPVRAVVDMESYVVCRGLGGAIARVRCARVVSDAAGEDLPGLLSGIGESGAGAGAPLGKIAVGVLREPRVMGDLLRLRRRLLDGAELLAGWVEERAGCGAVGTRPGELEGRYTPRVGREQD